MTNRTQEMLTKNMLGVCKTIEAFARQIGDGEYGDQWNVADLSGNVSTITANDEDNAIEEAYELAGIDALKLTDLTVERVHADEPTVNSTPISEYPLEIVDERGREFAVVVSGGPHIEVVADGGCSARLAGYWGGEQAYMYGDVFDTFLDYFIERD